MLKVSVVIPTHNHARFVNQAVDSALAQTWPESEIIVVDDGSTDDTSRVLAAYGDRVRILRQPNLGVAAARNAGARMAGGELLAFLDADDVWLPSKLAQQVRCFESEPELGLVHCGVEEIDLEGARLAIKMDGMEGLVADELLLFRRSVILGGGSAAVIPRTVFLGAGGFDTEMSTSADWDLYYRVARRFKVGFVPEALVRYRLHGANMHGNIRAMEHDMLRAYGKAFSDSSPGLRRLRRRAYGNLHSVLAGSFFAAAQYRGFINHALKSLLLTPENTGRFAGYPLRRWGRRSTPAQVSPSGDSGRLLKNRS